MNAHDDDNDDDRISANHLSHHQHTNPCVLHLTIGCFCLFSAHGFRFPSRSARFVIIFSTNTLQPLKFIYDTIIHTSRTYKIDGDELARYTTPYLNSYGLVGPFTFAPPSMFFLSYCTDEQQHITHTSSYSSSFFHMFWATSNALFFPSLHCHYHHVFFHPSFLLDSRSPAICIRIIFSIMSFHTPCLSSTVLRYIDRTWYPFLQRALAAIVFRP